jgi:hypothetical protein
VKRAGSKRRPVVLYQPRDAGLSMPLGLLALGSWLSDEHVVIVDGRFELAPEARVAELAREASCLGVSVRTGPPLVDALRVSAAARSANPRLLVVWGGPHATHAPQSCLATGVVDACVRGAGEEPFASVVDALRAGRAPGHSPGLVTRGGIVPRPAAPPGAEGLPRAAYALLDVERHFEARGARRLDYSSSRGVRDEPKTPFSGFTPDRVLGEVGELAERYRLSGIAFQDEDFFADPGRAEAIAAGLGERTPRVSWQAPVRLSDVLEGGPGRARLLARTGCRRIDVRPPDGSSLCGAAGEQLLEAGRLLHEAGVRARFELGLLEPGPDLGELRAAVRLARRLSAIDGHFETPVRRLSALPPSRLPGEAPETIEGWARLAEAPWPDARAESLLSRAAFFLAAAQRPPGRRPSKHLLRMASLLRVRLGFFAFDLDRRAVEVAALVRTGRSGPVFHGD